ncbi:glycosyltransferase family 2 protein [Falsigemmobacter faecalis]|uniref:Glycosyltransferase family 2 protein n=1 Tax=Falsigemmobacter faecalis TaxID=2488730 RepID=A0A3P3D9Y5_9RHOB|nr:glycosyltransferase family 2 protein [Falsigemmobacter faecalis]RRH71173.1 glycosyltransferase family 2 protein [Falsigemmobacter faecalis]
MRRDPPEISVIVPVFNLGAFGVAAVHSLLAQDFDDYEVLLVDDGSTDGSGTAAFAAAGGDPRFRLLRQQNLGLPAARNRALAAARGRFIAFLDGDDRYSPVFLSRMRAALLEDGGDWVACAFADCLPDGRQIPQPALYDRPMPRAAARWPLASLEGILAHYPSVWNKLYRRELLAGLSFEPGWFEDHVFWLRAALRSPAILHLPEPLYLQTRGRKGQLTTSDDERVFDQFPVLERLRHLLVSSGRPGAAEAFEDLAGRLLAERAQVLRDPGRRSRWIGATRHWLSRQGFDFPARHSPSLATALAGRMPVGVVADLSAGGDLSEAALEGLAGQDISAFSLIALTRPGAALPPRLAEFQRRCPDRLLIRLEMPPARPAPLRWRAALTGSEAEALVLCTGQEGFEPSALRLWADARRRGRADLAVSGLRLPAGGGWHDGWGDSAALSQPPAEGLALQPRPGGLPLLPLTANLLISRPLLSEALPPPDSPWPEGDLSLRLSAKAARIVWLGFPAVHPPLCPALRGTRVFERAEDLAVTRGLSGAQRRQFLLRVLQMQMDFGPPGAGRLRPLWLLPGVFYGRRRLSRAGLWPGEGPLDARLSRLLRPQGWR